MSEYTEPFLINPKKSKHRGKKHRPVAYSRSGHWFTSSKAKIVRPGIRLNPFAGGLMSVNPRRRHRRHHRHNPELAGVTNLGGFNWMSGIQPAVIMGGSILAGGLVPAFLQAKGYMTIDATWKKYGVQVGAGVVGVMALKAMKKPDWARYWGLGALVTVAVDLLAMYALPSIQSAIMPAPVATVPAATAGFGAFPREVRGVGAFPGSVRRVQSPYDRATVYPY